MVNFGAELAKEQVQEWAEFYVRYKKLTKAVEAAAKIVHDKIREQDTTPARIHLDNIPEHATFMARTVAEIQRASQFYDDQLRQAKVEFLALSRTAIQLGLVSSTSLSQSEGVTDPGSTIHMLLRHYQLPGDTVTFHSNGISPGSPDAIAGIKFVGDDENMVEGSRDGIANTIKKWVVGKPKPEHHNSALIDSITLEAAAAEEEEKKDEEEFLTLTLTLTLTPTLIQRRSQPKPTFCQVTPTATTRSWSLCRIE